jgi:hypothetical protein
MIQNEWHTWNFRTMLVVSFWIAFVVPKSMNLSSPLLNKKLASFKFEYTIHSLWMVFRACNTCSNKPHMKMLETPLWEVNTYYVQQEQCHKINSHKNLQRLSYKHRYSYTNQYNESQVELQLDFLHLVSFSNALLLALQRTCLPSKSPQILAS